LRRELASRPLLLVALCLAFLSAYPSTLLRSDSGHFESTTFAMPLLLALGVVHLHRLHPSATSHGRFLVAATVLLVAILTYLPSWTAAPERLVELTRGRWNSLSLAASAGTDSDSGPDSDSETARRYGPTLATTERARVFRELFTRIRARVRDDPVLVFIDIPRKLCNDPEYVFDGFVYFMADLVPGPILMERTDMVAGEEEREAFWKHLEENIDQVQWVLSIVPTAVEVELFRAAHPQASMEVFEVGEERLFLFGRGTAAGEGPEAAEAAEADRPDRETELRLYLARLDEALNDLDRLKRGLATQAVKPEWAADRLRIEERIQRVDFQKEELQRLRQGVESQLVSRG
jgi:hypothetical protein